MAVKKRTPIAEIALMPGQGGYWDPLSRIHLTAGNPHTIVYGGTNCAQLRRSVKAGRIRLVWGTLGSHVSPFKVELVNGKYVIAANEDDMKPVEAPEKEGALTENEEKEQEAPAKAEEKKADAAPKTEEKAAEAPKAEAKAAVEESKVAAKPAVKATAPEKKAEVKAAAAPAAKKAPAKKNTARKK